MFKSQKNNKLYNVLPISNFTKNFLFNMQAFIESKDVLSKTVKHYIEKSTSGNLKERRLFLNHIRAMLVSDITVYEDTNAQFPTPQGTIRLDENNIDVVIPFSDPSLLSPQDKFEILLFRYRCINSIGYDEAFKNLKTKYPYYEKFTTIDSSYSFQNKRYEYNAADIHKIYQEENITLTFDEKIEIITQRIYQDLYGIGCIDILGYSDVNEVGISNNGLYTFCWCSEKIWLSFLTIEEKELAILQQRCTSFDDKNGQLNTSNPEINCHRADLARVTVFQPPYFSTRHLRIRIFNHRQYGFKDTIQNPKQQLLIQCLLRIGEKGVLQGPLGTGKTTAMQAFMEVLQDTLHIGSIEDYLEQHNSIKYDYKCFVEGQMLDSKTVDNKFIPGKDLLDVLKSLLRASVDVINIGEVRDGMAIFAFLQVAQALSQTALFTGHVATPEDTIPRFKNMLIASGKYTTEQAAVADLVTYINTIYQLKVIDNKRYISETVEIVPLISTYAKIMCTMDTDLDTLNKLALIQQIQQNTAYLYTLNPILVYDYDRRELMFKNRPSKRIMDKVKTADTETQKLFNQLLELIDKDIEVSTND